MRVRDGGELSGGVVSEGDGRDFFVSYTGVNESWARCYRVMPVCPSE
jgi:hypothetical protein